MHAITLVVLCCHHGCRGCRGEHEDRRLKAGLERRATTGTFGFVDQDRLGQTS